ncbi:MAG: hypothetical protein M1827_001154 [Pycnora praestabilis]|nr:MAG: hypothetical protein M1827_001154 [Pycnora praestabilis]
MQLGLHVPSEILAQVISNAAATAEGRKKAVAHKDDRDMAKARSVLFRLYPHIPEKDVKEILNHGFLKGSGRVGRVTGLSDQDRVRLAAFAHVRHTLTPYESLYKDWLQKPIAKGYPRVPEKIRKEFQDQVRPQVLAIIRLWNPHSTPPKIGILNPTTKKQANNDISRKDDRTSTLKKRLEGKKTKQQRAGKPLSEIIKKSSGVIRHSTHEIPERAKDGTSTAEIEQDIDDLYPGKDSSINSSDYEVFADDLMDWTANYNNENGIDELGDGFNKDMETAFPQNSDDHSPRKRGRPPMKSSTKQSKTITPNVTPKSKPLVPPHAPLP